MTVSEGDVGSHLVPMRISQLLASPPGWVCNGIPTAGSGDIVYTHIVRRDYVVDPPRFQRVRATGIGNQIGRCRRGHRREALGGHSPVRNERTISEASVGVLPSAVAHELWIGHVA